MTAKDLKNALLQEAVMGKLVPQIASEGNARDLLEEIKNSHTDLQISTKSAGTDKKNSDLRSKSQIRVTKKEVAPITDEEVPFDIPESWCWCRLGEICNEIKRGKSPKYTAKSDYLAFAQKCNVKTGGIDLGLALYLDEKSIDRYSEEDNLIQGDIVINSTGGGTMGRVGYYETKVPNGIKGVYPDSHVTVIRSIGNINQNYLYYVLKYNQPILEKCGTGSTNQTELKPAVLSNFLIPLPPLAEQKRIVAAIEKFMPLIEEYGKKESALNLLNTQIASLTKKAILQEAVQGHLVPQIATEGNAKDLLAEIKKSHTDLQISTKSAGAKSDLRSKSQIRVTKKELPPITQEEIPFDIPESWCWCRLGEVFQLTMGQSPEGTNVGETIKGMEFHQGKIFFTEKYISQSNQQTSEVTKIAEPGSILLCMRAPVGKVNLTNRQICIGRGLSAVVPLGGISLEWAFYLFETLETDFVKKSTGSTFKAITGDVVKNELIPLPPLAEQKRIVSAIEKLLPLCKKLGQ